MPIDIENDIQRIHSMGFLDKLLMDKTTGRHILWATDTYASLGDGYGSTDEIMPEQVAGTDVIRPRALKAQAQQSDRTRQHGEVFTPLWVCRKMCDYADKALDGGDWKKYVDARVLEITCGEAPFLVSRYHMETGEIIPVMERIGLLDRKLQAVNRNTDTEGEWLKWTFKAFRETYGYEFQGDNLLTARVNLLATFEDYLMDRWCRKPTKSEYRQIINVVVWNVWQMDGLKGTIPYGTIEGYPEQISLFELMGETPEPEGDGVEQPPCRIRNWRCGGQIEYLKLPVRGKRAMKFDFIIGNPPYQEETDSDSTRKPPIYNYFMDQSYELASVVELITPSRFLFNAGYTPKAWNEKMLNDPHFNVVYYEPDCTKIFPNTDIKGGIVITCRDETKDFGVIGTFTRFPELNSILKKVKRISTEYLDGVISATLSFKLSPLMLKEHPDSIGRLRTSAFTNLADIFFETRPDDGHDYIVMVGLLQGKRVRRFVRRDYVIDSSDTLDRYTLLIPNASGSGSFGERLSNPEIAEPGVAYTQTFNAFGSFDNRQYVENMEKYIQAKFTRALLGVLKITQHCPAPKWKYVPLQDFTSASDIDWAKSIPEIDRQLYAKYGLDDGEIEFIESHVKEME